MSISSVAVFCGSRFGVRPEFHAAATELGTRLGQAGLRLVYGGGHVGLMGAVADAALKAGGKVTGIIPAFLHDREIMHEGVTDLTVTTSMHDRKAMMFSRADAFVVMPGGLGTFDETIEIMTWRQLRQHDKPIFIVNIARWAAPLIAMIEATIESGFASPDVRELFRVVDDVPAVMRALHETATSSGNVNVDHF
ncbi:LOG family protein [Novacetimonas pomaceti]|uniref:Cytokinin riboside 5'-monophosphate phosphoribohydrolase n=1 Tax=Novacetimonas pomaceti TaxID=2021998 RepID=A0A318Q9I3_9PROT|nr:TIGR00730 family Rossman fold protein [Novacetimonas pomaceti]MBV1835361.1 TIGR00730 family Rossman fold protein [Novacetimonas pomaceti]PYD46834.1 TIGR00730 family Rossman fold protein [Novacetimonas pomaceti]PYD76317.1 Rossman fold protein, TIGR00730 family [Novacetimonas pomaceti]